MGSREWGKGGTIFRQSLRDFPCPVVLGKNTPSFGLHRYKQGLRFVPPDDEGFALRGDKRRLLYKGRRRSHRFTILGDTSFEYDCILLREPDTNVITLLIEGAECFDFFRQPDFVKDPFLKGSYAVYKKETLIGEGTGKLCHIHRPLIIDARGRRVWGTLAVVGNELRITVPEQWLAGAKYPVVVDPMIGTDVIGYQRNYDIVEFCYDIAVNRFYVPQTINGTCVAYAYSLEQDPVDAYGVIYSDNGNKPSNKLSKNEEYFSLQIENCLDDWRCGTFELKASISGGAYIWFGFLVDVWAPFYDFGATCYYTEQWNIWSPPDTFPSARYSRDMKLSMYFTYVNAQNYVRILTQGVKLADSRKTTGTYKRSVTQTAKPNDVIGRYVTFYRQCVMNVTNSVFVNKTVVILRTSIEHIGIISDILNCRELIHTIVETVQAGDFTQRIHTVLREIRDTVSGGDVLMYPVLFVRSIHETQTISGIIHKWGDYIRGLVDIAENTAGTVHQGEYYRTESDTVQVQGLTIRGLLFFVRIITQVFVRDYLLGRFLIAREELVLKSCVCQELKIDSKIN